MRGQALVEPVTFNTAEGPSPSKGLDENTDSVDHAPGMSLAPSGVKPVHALALAGVMVIGGYFLLHKLIE
jgi:hypothetical protein